MKYVLMRRQINTEGSSPFSYYKSGGDRGWKTSKDEATHYSDLESAERDRLNLFTRAQRAFISIEEVKEQPMKPSAATQKAYDETPSAVREDLAEALDWANQVLTNHEGAGHVFEVFATREEDGCVVCTFSKPSWAGEHSGPPMEAGSEAVVMAVCSYLNGQ